MIALNNVGTLYVIATPIGNLGDITLRALETLRSVDQIAAENTQRARILLHHYSIKKSTFSLHAMNERQRLKKVLDWLHSGQSVALISDAGTPLISDPGCYLIDAANAAGIPVYAIPGPCAAIAALSVAGLATQPFTFIGFLSTLSSVRRNRLMQLSKIEHTLVFYEAPHRLLLFLKLLAEIFGLDRKVVVARELTKYHESIVRGSIEEVLEHYQIHVKEQCGEIVVLVAGHLVTIADRSHELLKEHSLDVLKILLNELPIKQAVKLTSAITGDRKNALYKIAIDYKNKFSLIGVKR